MSDARRTGGRRRFLKAVPAAVAGSLALPALAQEQARRISKDTLECGEKIFGVDFSDAEEEQALAGVNRNLDAYEQLRTFDVPLDTEPETTSGPWRPWIVGRTEIVMAAGATTSRAICSSALRNISSVGWLPKLMLASTL